MAYSVRRSQRFFRVSVLALTLVSLSCGSDDDSGAWFIPAQPSSGACVCYDGAFNFQSCVVTSSYSACQSTVTTCNPTFITNTDCSQWCPGSPERCP